MSWERFQRYYLPIETLGFALDVSRMDFSESYMEAMEPRMQRAFKAMQELEGGSIANTGEHRQVGHYWLRSLERAPSSEIRKAIETTLTRVLSFARRVHDGTLRGARGPFKDLLVIGIGGSALGPQCVSRALGHPRNDRLRLHFFDNTDPDGMAHVLSTLEGRLGQTLVLVTSKSGSTPETRNGMIEAQAAYAKAGLNFSNHAVAVTGTGSQLDHAAANWLERFPMWEWVGGRTSELAAVGLLPAALQGLDVEGLLAGARKMDAVTRLWETGRNPAALLALMWYAATEGKGAKAMVVLPYKDSLELLPRYLQQLVMESLGKANDLDGKSVHQGLTVYGNKGSTDQHAYVQQLRDGLDNFFITFIEVLEDRRDGGVSADVELDTTSGDFLQAFLLGTREALSESGRQSLTITLHSVTAESMGMLIALFERAVGFYASLINVNAYDQPGVEAGKKAAAAVLHLKRKVMGWLRSHPGEVYTATELAQALRIEGREETLFKLLEHLAANPHKYVTRILGASLRQNRYACERLQAKNL